MYSGNMIKFPLYWLNQVQYIELVEPFERVIVSERYYSRFTRMWTTYKKLRKQPKKLSMY